MPLQDSLVPHVVGIRVLALYRRSEARDRAWRIPATRNQLFVLLNETVNCVGHGFNISLCLPPFYRGASLQELRPRLSEIPVTQTERKPRKVVARQFLVKLLPVRPLQLCLRIGIRLLIEPLAYGVEFPQHRGEHALEYVHAVSSENLLGLWVELRRGLLQRCKLLLRLGALCALCIKLLLRLGALCALCIKLLLRLLQPSLLGIKSMCLFLELCQLCV